MPSATASSGPEPGTVPSCAGCGDDAGRPRTRLSTAAQLVDLATGSLVEHQVLLPGFSVLQRLCARARDRAERRLWRLLRVI